VSHIDRRWSTTTSDCFVLYGHSSTIVLVLLLKGYRFKGRVSGSERRKEDVTGHSLTTVVKNWRQRGGKTTDITKIRRQFRIFGYRAEGKRKERERRLVWFERKERVLLFYFVSTRECVVGTAISSLSWREKEEWHSSWPTFRMRWGIPSSVYRLVAFQVRILHSCVFCFLVHVRNRRNVYFHFAALEAWGDKFFVGTNGGYLMQYRIEPPTDPGSLAVR